MIKEEVKRMKKSWLKWLIGGLCVCSLNVISTQKEQVWAAEGDQSSNAVPDEVYQDFGLDITDPKEFATSEDPLQGFETYPLSELYVGHMNRDDDGHFKGKRHLLESLSTSLNDSTINIDKWDKAKATQTKDYHYYSDKYDFEYQFNNAVSFYGEGKDKPALLLEAFYGAGEVKDIETERNEHRYNRLMLQLSKRDSYTSDYKYVGFDGGGVTRHKVLLSDLSTDKKYDFLEVPADRTSGLSAMIPGDFDGDGREEVAVYCPSTRKDSGYGQGGYITFFGYDSKLGLFEHDGTKGKLTKIYLKDLASSAAGTSWNSDVKKQVKRSVDGDTWKNLPLVQLSKSTLAKKYNQLNDEKLPEMDDLVISLSTPEGSGGGDSTLAIYSFIKEGKQATKFQEIFAHQFEGDNEKFEYLAAQMGDLNGDTVDELVVAGRNGKKHEQNLLQMITYEKNAANENNKPEYNFILAKPASIQKHSKLDLKQPISLAIGNYHAGIFRDSIFIGGRIVDVDSGSLKSDKAKSQATIFKDSKFLEKTEIQLSGTKKNPFIHSAYFTHLSSKEVSEQLVTVSGDFDSEAGQDEVYMDMGVSGEVDEKISTKYHNNIIHNSDPEDNGTFLTVVPVNLDDDKMSIKYTGKHTGWTKPQLLAILQANPYWRELSRVSDADAFGSTKFSIATGQGHEESGSWGIGGGFSFKFAAGSKRHKGTLGLDAAAHYLSETSQQKQTTEERGFTSLAEDSVILQAQPIVTHCYEVIVPVEQGGDGQVEPMEIPQTLAATFGHISLEKYQQAAAQAKKQAIDYPEVDMNTLLGTSNYQVGDPSTYQKVNGQNNIPIANEPNYFDREEKIGTYKEYKDTIEINSNMGNVSDYSLTIATESSKGEGWDINAAISAGYKYDGRYFNVEGSGNISGIGSQMFTDIRTSGTTFSYSYPSIKTEKDNIFAGTSYNQKQFDYAVKPAVWRTSAIDNGVAIDQSKVEDGDIYIDNHPYVMGHLVSLKEDQPVSPDVPKETHISKIGSHEVELKWENKYQANREPDKIEIYEAMGDNVGDVYKKRGVVDLKADDKSANSFVVGGLKAGTEYRYRVRSVYQKNGKEVYSPLQPIATEDNQLENYLKATTLAEEDELTFKPLKDVSVLPGEEAQFQAELTSEAEEISFGWSRYQISANSYNGKWMMLEESEKTTIASLANLSTLTIDSVANEDSGYYRAIAAQGNSGRDAVSDSARLTLAAAKRQATGDPQIKVELLESDRPNQFVALDGQAGKYYVNQAGDLKVKATVEDSNATGKVAFYLYDEAGNELSHTEQQALKAGEVTTDLKDVAKANTNIVAVYFDEAHGEGIPAIALELLATWPEEQRLTEQPAEQQAMAAPAEQAESYDVAYNLNDGIDPGNPTSQNPIEGLTLKDPTKEGYEFLGWYYSPTNAGDKTKKAPTVLKGYTNNLELEAKWEPKKYHIFYQLGDWKTVQENPDKFTLEQLRLGLVEIHNAIQGTERGNWYINYQRKTPFKTLTDKNLGNIFLSSPAKVEDQPVTPEEEEPEQSKDSGSSSTSTTGDKEKGGTVPSSDSSKNNGKGNKTASGAASTKASKNLPQTNDRSNNWFWLGLVLIVGVLLKVVYDRRKK